MGPCLSPGSIVEQIYLRSTVNPRATEPNLISALAARETSQSTSLIRWGACKHYELPRWASREAQRFRSRVRSGIAGAHRKTVVLDIYMQWMFYV